MRKYILLIFMILSLVSPAFGGDGDPVREGKLAGSISATLVNSITFDTNVAAAGVTLSGTTLAADGTDTNISINLTPKGTGDVAIGAFDVTMTGSLAATGARVTKGWFSDLESTTITENGNAVPNVMDNLSVFAATTSAQLFGVLSDETGSSAGALAVFSISPIITTDLSIQGLTGAVSTLYITADAGEDNSDKWKFEAADGGDVTLQSYTSGAWVAKATFTNAGNLTVAGFVPSTKTDDYVVTTADFGKSLRMNAATAKNFTLPSVGATEDGARLIFIKQGVGRMTVTAVDTDYIHDSSATGTIYTDSLYSTLTLEYVHGMTRWVIVAATGVLTTT